MGLQVNTRASACACEQSGERQAWQGWMQQPGKGGGGGAHPEGGEEKVVVQHRFALLQLLLGALEVEVHVQADQEFGDCILVRVLLLRRRRSQDVIEPRTAYQVSKQGVIASS